jgi:hypothetical protein
MIKPACSVCLLLHFLQQNIKTCEQLTRNVKKKRAAEKQENFPSLNLSLSLSLSLCVAHCKSVCLQAVTLSFCHEHSFLTLLCKSPTIVSDSKRKRLDPHTHTHKKRGRISTVGDQTTLLHQLGKNHRIDDQEKQQQ